MRKWQHLQGRHCAEPAPADLARRARHARVKRREDREFAPVLWSRRVELLGAIPGDIGSGVPHAASAKRLRYRVYRHLPRLGLERRMPEGILTATVCALMLYCVAVRANSTQEFAQHQSFLTLSAMRMLRKMKGNSMQTRPAPRVGCGHAPPRSTTSAWTVWGSCYGIRPTAQNARRCLAGSSRRRACHSRASMRCNWLRQCFNLLHFSGRRNRRLRQPPPRGTSWGWIARFGAR